MSETKKMILASAGLLVLRLFVRPGLAALPLALNMLVTAFAAVFAAPALTGPGSHQDRSV